MPSDRHSRGPAIARCSFVAAAVAIFVGCGGETPVAPPASAPASPPSVPPQVTELPSTADGGAAPATTTGPLELTAKPFALPGVTAPAFLDYIAYERSPSRVWVPVGSTGSVDVFDIASSTFTRVDGFKTVERETTAHGGGGKKRTLGPSAAAVGDGFVYVGNRATSEVCPVDTKTLKVQKCITLPVKTDGVAYVASTKEVWVTTGDNALTVLDASKPDALKSKTVVKVLGAPEGYAVDEAHGLFFTNLEDKGGTVAIDVKTHTVKSTWNAGCGADGPRGLAVDSARNLLFVACTDHIQALDTAHDGALLGKLDAGAGVDNIDYLDATKLLFVAAGKAARLTIARVDGRGLFTVVATGTTGPGARNAVADVRGNAYVADSQGGHLLVLPAKPGIE